MGSGNCGTSSVKRLVRPSAAWMGVWTARFWAAMVDSAEASCVSRCFSAAADCWSTAFWVERVAASWAESWRADRQASASRAMARAAAIRTMVWSVGFI
jgi:hypothetical protein